MRVLRQVDPPPPKLYLLLHSLGCPSQELPCPKGVCHLFRLLSPCHTETSRCSSLTAPKMPRHRLLSPTQAPASTMVNESSARPAIAGFLLANRAKLHKLGHSTVLSVAPHPHLLLRLRHLQSRGLLLPANSIAKILIDLICYP